MARLLELQGRAVKAGFRKPTYSELVERLILTHDVVDAADLTAFLYPEDSS